MLHGAAVSPRASLLVLALIMGCGPSAEPITPAPPAPDPTPIFAPLEAPPVPLAIAEDPGAAAAIDADVRYLASPELAGRGTGEEGGYKAAEHVKKRFQSLGLVPLGAATGEPTYEQPFEAVVGAKAAPAELVIKVGGKARALPKGASIGTADGAASGKAEGKAVFVGYGISSASAFWDDYAGGDVEGAIAIVLAGTPAVDRAAPPVQKGAPNPALLKDFGAFRYKIRTARDHKAKGVVIVTMSEVAPPDDPSSMGVPAVMITRATAKALFPGLPLDKAPHSPAPPKVLTGTTIEVGTQVDPKLAPSANVIGLLPARSGSPRAEEVVVVGAHYDHLGLTHHRFSMASGDKRPHYGADDNASGTALMMDVARRMAALPRRPDRGILFMAFGAEEIGCIGSRYWVEHPTLPLTKVVAMINADMVGRLRESRLIVDGTASSPAWPLLLDKANQGLGLTLALGLESFGSSDHASFTAAKVPVAFFFTGAHDDYHKPTDTADKINVAGEAKVATIAARLALMLAEQEGRVPFAEEQANDPHKGGRGGFKVSLGTMPDYAFQGKGLKLTGVRPDSPASRAGLAAGDVITKVDKHPVANVHDYMFALGDLEPGREVEVVIERSGKTMTLKVIPAPGTR